MSRGRPTLFENKMTCVRVHVPDEILEYAKEAGKREHLSRAIVLRRLMLAGMAQEKKPRQ